MPLKRGSSSATRSENVSEMVRAGYPRNQAVAAAYRQQRISRRLRHGKRKAKRGRR